MKKFGIPPRLNDALTKKMRKANTMCRRWEGEVAMRAEDRKVQAQRKKKEERKEKEAQRRAATVKVAEEQAVKARDVEKESAEDSKKQPEVSKEGVEGSKKPADALKEASSGAFGIGALVVSIGEPLAKASGSSNAQDSGGKTTVSSTSDAGANTPPQRRIRGMVTSRLPQVSESVKHKVSLFVVEYSFF